MGIALNSLRPGDELVVARWDDLADSLEDLCVLLRRIEETGVSLRVLSDKIATSDPQSRLVLKGMLLAAELQGRLSAARLRQAVAEARGRGAFPTGRPRTVSAERVAELRAAGLGATAIARQLGVARASIYRKLKEIEAPGTRRLGGQGSPVDAAAVARLRDQGLNAVDIARRLGASQASIYRRLKALRAADR